MLLAEKIIQCHLVTHSYSENKVAKSMTWIMTISELCPEYFDPSVLPVTYSLCYFYIGWKDIS